MATEDEYSRGPTTSLAAVSNFSIWLGVCQLILAYPAANLADNMAYEFVGYWWPPIVLLALFTFIAGLLGRYGDGDRQGISLTWRISVLGVIIAGTLAWSSLFGFFIQQSYSQTALAGLLIALVPILLYLAATIFWWPAFLSALGTLAYSFSVFPTTRFFSAYPDWGLWAFVLALVVMGSLSVAVAYLYSQKRDEAGTYRKKVIEAEGDQDELEKEIDDLTQLLMDLNVTLAESRKEAEDGVRAKTEFLATMSHEIRTPLNSIIPLLEILESSNVDFDQREMLLTAYQSSKQLLRIIDDILDYSKAESGLLAIESIEINVADLVISIAGLMQTLAHQKGLKLNYKIDEDIPDWLRGDPIRLRQILTNLLSNAIKFTETGSIEIKVMRRRTTPTEMEVQFEVKDTGIGITKENIRLLFKPFSQADASTTRKYGGTGLGLVICKRLVEIMRGRIGVRSTPDKGSIFWFNIPFRLSVREQVAKRKSLEGLRVLTLMGDENMAAQISKWMNSWGMTEQRAQNAIDALSKLDTLSRVGQTWVQHLLIVDVANLGSTSLNLLKEIKDNRRLSGLEVIALVGSAEEGHQLTQSYGASCMELPVQAESMRLYLNRVFDVETHTSIPAREYDDVTFYEEINREESVAYSLERLDTGKKDEDQQVWRVLLVEDNPVNMQVARRVLGKLNVQCDLAENGMEALKAAKLRDYDLILMDCQMPVMDGFEATRAIRSFESKTRHPRVPIVAMTANAMDGDREACLDVGMDDYMPKPVGLNEMQRLMDIWIGRTSNYVPPEEKIVDDTEPVALPVTENVDTEMDRGEQAMISEDSESGSAEEDVSTFSEEYRDEEFIADVLDLEIIDELKEVMEEGFVDILNSYINNTPDLMTNLKEAVAAQDVAAMIIPVHSLKSSSANVGAMKLSALARDAETAARQGDFPKAAAMYEELLLSYEEAIAALKILAAD